MAAALFRRATGLCCIHRDLCRLVWRSQTALFSSKPSDGKQPRRTHIKKAKPQPAVDVAKLLEQLFSQQRPGTAPPAARPAKASSMPTKPPTTSSMKVSTSNVPPLSKTEPAVPAFPATSTTPASLGSEAVAIDIIIETHGETATAPPISACMVEKNVETSSFSAATVEPLLETTTESPVESSLSPVEKLESRAEGPVEPTVDEVQTKDSGVVDVSHAAKEEPIIETTIESPVEASLFHVETVETRAAVVEAPVEPAIEVTVDVAAETKSANSGVVNISHAATVEPLLETTVEPSVEARIGSPLETLESRAAVVERPVEPIVDAPAQAVQTNSTNSGPVNLPHTAAVEPLIETTIHPSAEATTSPLETLESRGSVETKIETEADTAAQVGQINSSDSGVINVSYSAKEEPLIETTIEPVVEASPSPLESRAAVSEAVIENEAADNLSHTALIQDAHESAPLPLKNEVESTVESESGNVAVEEQVSKSEQMSLESVTLHVVEVQVESLKTDELLQTKSVLDEKAEKELQELLVETGTGAEHKVVAGNENSSEDESEILTEVLSKWDSLSEDLQVFEGESGTLVKELLCHVPAVLSKTPGTVRTSSASDPPAGANGEPLQMEEKGTEAEAMTLESLTLANVKAEVESLKTEVLLETRNALEKEAEVQAKEEKMEVMTTAEDVAVFEDTTEAEILALDAISEATDAIEAETSVLLEAMFGSEQGLRQPPDTLLVDQNLGQQGEAFSQEAEKESGAQEGNILKAMTLESVTLAEVEASLGTLENESLSETSDYLEKEAEILAGENRMEVEDGMASEEMTEALKIEYLSLPEADALSETLQTDALMEELLFSVPGPVKGVTEDSSGQEAVRANSLDATVATGSVDVDTAAAVTDDFPASPALTEEPLGQEVEEEGAQTEALGNEDGEGTYAGLDPVQRLFLEKIREYDNMRRLNGGLLEVEPDYEKYLSEETAKLQRLYGGGDLSRFPEFTFTEPEMDQDSK